MQDTIIDWVIRIAYTLLILGVVIGLANGELIEAIRTEPTCACER